LNSIQVEVGKKVPVGTIIATLSDKPGEVAGKELAASARAVLAPQPQQRTAPASESSAGVASERPGGGAGVSRPEGTNFRKTIASPRARRLAETLGIDISTVKPAHGPRIVEEDVRRFQASTQEIPARAPAEETLLIPDRASVTRKVAAQRMTESFRAAPHFYLGVEANAADIVRLRDQLLPPFNQLTRLKLTYTDLFLRAMAIGLKEHPHVNAFWQNDGIQLRDSIDIGFAVQTSVGLLVPVIRKADGLSLFDLARRRHELTEKARGGRLTLHEIEGGSATLSNLGSFGIDWFHAILNPPQSVILATGRISRRAMVVNDSLEVCPALVLSLSVDHRVLDGVTAANFLARIKALIESPSIMLL
jgi:pyruvate dehydrogenase E2 component (dihydrolipoamide acetyltransferase)